ncbi:hypothetical protein [Comamonas sp. GB3 AK4-5]|uniref:hypothetical protein n=1 Tax=Comamonas sp. GB3 AK4-5 TaxID=3231487 RepID=UPI00351E9343
MGAGLNANQRLQPPAAQGAGPVSFSAALSAAQSNNEAPKAPQTTSGEWTWTESEEGISHAIGPDGREWRKLDLDKLMTPEDKLLTGWPTSHDAKAQEIAMFIAMDRADGYLKGPVTPDYLLGNSSKGLVGLAERSPTLSRADLDGLLKQLA